MNPEEIIQEIYADGPWVSDPEEGVYCFYCGCKHQDSFYGGIFKHHWRCVWLKIEEVVAKRH